MANVYSFNAVKDAVKCSQYLKERGIELGRDNRCAAVWRNGTNPESVHVDDENNQWFDFAEGRGGSVIDLCAAIETNGDIMMAVQKLGDRFNVPPITSKRKIIKTRSQTLIADGYTRTDTYTYSGEDGTVVYYVDRYEKEGAKKEFIQRTPEHEGLDKDTPKLLYNLPAVIKSQEVFVVEGEKDCETLRSFGLVGTTNSGGASNGWDECYNKYFSGKDVVIICDNDEPGQKHGQNLNSVLKPIAKSVKVITISKLPKGDVTDWVRKEGGTAASLREIVSASCEVKADSPEIAKAKMANEVPFTNYHKMIVAGKGGRSKCEEIPYTIRQLADEVRTRFLGFPRVLGETMFDWHKDKKEVVYLASKNELFAWIQSTSGKNVNWGSGPNYVSRDELYCELNRTSIHYSGLSRVPHYPTRADVFYTHDPLPAPDPSHHSFWTLVDYFNPASPAYKTMIAALVAAPLYYSETAARPMWIVDTDDAQSSGKTTLVKLISHLYGDDPFIFDFATVNKDLGQLMRRMISSSGRQKRIALLDNATGTLRSSNLATLVTLGSLTGLAPYGRTEESRPNDITYIVTANGASVDTDIATRSYTVRLKAPENPDPSWETEVKNFIDANRGQIFSDLLHMIQNNPLKVQRKRSRFGMFDRVILSAVCKTAEEFEAADRAICNEAERANEDQDRASDFTDIFLDAIAKSEQVSTENAIFMRAPDVDYLLENSSSALQKWKCSQIQQLIRQGMLQNFDKRFDRIPDGFDGLPRYRGILFGERKPGQDTLVQILSRKIGGTFEVMRTITLPGKKVK